MCLQPRRERPVDSRPVAYLIVSASALFLGAGAGFCPPGAAVVALVAWLLTAAAAEVVAGGVRRLNVLPWALGAVLLAAYCGPGAVTALLGTAAVVYGVTTVAIAVPIRRVAPVVRRVEPVGRTFDVATDRNVLSGLPTTTGPIPVFTLA